MTLASISVLMISTRLDPHGDAVLPRLVFLEPNPNGQWYWIELSTGAPMADAMSDLLSAS
jgi:hypothetical protein